MIIAHCWSECQLNGERSQKLLSQLKVNKYMCNFRRVHKVTSSMVLFDNGDDFSCISRRSDNSEMSRWVHQSGK